MEIIVAFISAGTALLVAIYSAFAAAKNQKKIDTNNEEIEFLKSKLNEEQSERNALRDYKYEAKKRLYHEYEPLIFELLDLAETALARIAKLAEGARGDTEIMAWMERDTSFFTSTVYNLIIPLAAIKNIQRKITSFDLSIDSKIYSQYLLCKGITLAIQSDYDIARIDPGLAYDPYDDDWKEKRLKKPEIFYRQGIPSHRLDTSTDYLIEPGGSIRLMSFGKFEDQFKMAKDDEYSTPLGLLKDLFRNFFPQNRPVLWRILSIQYIFYYLLIKTRLQKVITTESMKEAIDTFDSEILSRTSVKADTKEITAIEAVKKYVSDFINKNFKFDQ